MPLPDTVSRQANGVWDVGHALEYLEIPLHVTDEAKLANVLLPLRADVARDDLAISVLKT